MQRYLTKIHDFSAKKGKKGVFQGYLILMLKSI